MFTILPLIELECLSKNIKGSKTVSVESHIQTTFANYLSWCDTYKMLFYYVKFYGHVLKKMDLQNSSPNPVYKHYDDLHWKHLTDAWFKNVEYVGI